MWWNKYLGIPFKEKGRDVDSVDCWGLVRLVYGQELGVEIPSYLECYKTTNDKEVLSAKIASEWKAQWEEPTTPKEFDVIVLKMAGFPMHVGIVTKPGFMLHCAKDINTVHESFTSMRWKNKVMGYGRWIS